MKMPKIGTKSDLFGYFGLEFRKTIVIFKISTFELVQLKNFVKKQKCQILGPKMPYLDIFDQKCLLWVFLGKNFKKAVVIFVISTLKFVYLQNFTEKQKHLNLDQKCLIYEFLGWNLRTIWSYLKSASSNLPYWKILLKNKNT